ncbi:C-5 cytosine-specific DNA methylase [Pseudomonas putida]|nr:C-5 cytosine-specific DNA methylase [Pseudomonas putida]
MLQTFPADYEFCPPGTPVRFNKLGRLIGNAVPVRLGEVIAKTLLNHVSIYSEHRESLIFQ